MAGTTKTAPNLPATPWGSLPPNLRALWITTPRRGGAWLAESFAGDSACQVQLDEARGAATGLERLREQLFDTVFISHAPGELDALELLDALRGGGGEEPLIVLGDASPQEMEALCLEAGADAYVCVNTATTRTLLWIVARATERHALLRENRRLAEGERHRLEQEQREAESLLAQQRELIRAAQAAPATDATSNEAPPLAESLKNHYRELLRAHVIMGSGNLSREMAALAELLAGGNVTAPQTMLLHVQVLEELVRGLGVRSARHVMNRADLLVLELLVHLAERYRAPRKDRTMADDATTIAELRAIVDQFVRERDWTQFHTPKNLAMALAIEAAELMEHFQWLEPAESRAVADDSAKRQAAGEELADVVCYALALANELKLDVSDALRAKMVKNVQKYPADQFRGRWGAGDGGRSSQ